ncbi:MAG: serine/threonine-protein kinase [Bryobacterales bacterium]|nr:serine/threonine-protein kinase [Bryobacterales bacterium]
MPLAAGDQLGPYEVLAPLGAGGMGEVYRARDTRLGRTVAVKVLPEHIAQREDARARFEREARAVASLNHPNICVLHDIGPNYMVLELIEGETLAARIEKGAIPLDQAFKLATQIADALDRAHRAGVTHRDVKPQNIMLTRDGVKVLDFGLAKSTAKPAPTQETLTAVLTTEGTVLGTPQYMAPEQFEGKEADARSDIWAFGAVLYEMVTGQKAFQGKSYSSLVGAILSADPPPMSVKPFTPTWLERLVRRCLAKDPEDRRQSMRDIVIELRTPPVESRVERPNRWPWAVALSTLVLGVLAGWVVSGFRQAPAQEVVYRAQLNPPEGGQFEFTRGLTLSPDSRLLVFYANAPGKRGLWVRPMGATSARLLPGTEGALSPFWSPDSRSVAYAANGKLWRVEVDGGAPIPICDVRLVAGGGWAPDGRIVFGNVSSGLGLSRVSASGGTPEVLTAVNSARGEISHRHPQMLPGGGVLFQVTGKQAGLYATSLANPREPVHLVATEGNGLYAAGHLLWLRDSTLMAQPFDPERLRLSGEPRPVSDPVGANGLSGAVAAASGGVLVYGRQAGLQLSWLDREGKSAGTPPGQADDYNRFRVSPDGRRIVIGRTSGSRRDLWMVDIERDAWSRFTFMPGPALYPIWSRDGRHVLFQAGSSITLYGKEASGAGVEYRVTESANPQWPNDWSRDGRLVLYYEEAPDTKRDLWVLPMAPDGKPEPGARPRSYLRTRFSEWGGRFSPEPNPRWVAYTSDESGRDEVYVQAFPEPRGKFQISTAGGIFPEWSPDGRELYYVASEGKLLAVGLKLGVDSVTPSTPQELFALPVGLGNQAYAVAPDGKRFLVARPAGGSQPLEVVVNWPALLKQKATSE